jgi:RNA polymerase sigma-70 factor (ECF subfamily)
MSDAPLDTLLEKLTSGDSEAAERVFRSYEPFLRALVRRRLTPPLRTKFDSMDVVQSVWADVLSGFRAGDRKFKDRDHLRTFLAKVTYNHFVNHCRSRGGELAHEQRLDGAASPRELASNQPRPSQIAQADELWRTMLELCPPAHRQILELKRQGLPLAEIASRTGLHEGSVRRVLYELAARLARKSKRDSR